MNLHKLLIVFVVLFSSNNAFASFSCNVNTTTNSKTCHYTGKIKSIYLNKAGTLLVYPLENIDISLATDTGGFSGVSRAAYFYVGKLYSDDSVYMEFTKGVKALLTSAKIADREVTLTFYDPGNGDESQYRQGSYLKLNRMSLK